MASFAGWYGDLSYGPSVLARMTGSMDGLEPVHEEHISSQFGVGTTQPGLAGDIKRIAVSEDGQTVVAFAGYLYTEDEAARTAPAEHCLSLFRNHGTDFARTLNGTFAIAIAATGRGILHLISDRLCTRPIYYTESNGGIFFGTEVKAIRAVPDLLWAPNNARLIEFLALSCVTGGNTLYDQVKRIPGATVLTWRDGSASALRYWRPVFTWSGTETLHESAERMAEALRNSVRRACAGHTRVGLMLSGGLDSRAVAAAAPCKLHCFTLHLQRSREVDTAKRVAEVLGYPHTMVEVPPTYPLELLAEGSNIGDGMNAFHHAQALYLREHVERMQLSTVLNGWMILDALQGAYLPVQSRSHPFQRVRPPSLAGPDEWNPVAAFIDKFRTAPLSLLVDLLGPSVTPVLEGVRSQLSSRCRSLREDGTSSHDIADIVLGEIANLAQHRTHLNTRALGRSVAEGIPGWDNEIVNALLNTPPAHRFNHIAYRNAIMYLNRKAASIPYTTTGVPVRHGPVREHWQSAVVGKLRRVGKILRAGLRPRPPSNGAWPSRSAAMKKRPEWRSALRRNIDGSRLMKMGLLDGACLRELVHDHIEGRRNNANLIGTWLTLEQWLNEQQF